MKGFCYYRNELVSVIDVVRNSWANRTEYLIVRDYQTEWVSEYDVTEVVWKIG